MHAKFVVIDLETTGFSPASDAIIELGGVKVDTDTGEITTFGELVNPWRDIPYRIQQQTGISEDMVYGCRDIEEVFPDFMVFVGDLPIVAHNAQFDMRFLKHAAASQGYELENEVVCTLVLAREKWPHFPNHKLQTLVQQLGIKVARAHRSLDDCFAALAVYRAASEA